MLKLGSICQGILKRKFVLSYMGGCMGGLSQKAFTCVQGQRVGQKCDGFGCTYFLDDP